MATDEDSLWNENNERISDLRARVSELEEIVATLIGHQHYFVPSSSGGGTTTRPIGMSGTRV